MPRFARETLFSGNFKHYMGKEDGRFDKDAQHAGARLDRREQLYNLRDIQDGLKTFHEKKMSSTRTTLNME